VRIFSRLAILAERKSCAFRGRPIISMRLRRRPARLSSIATLFRAWSAIDKPRRSPAPRRVFRRAGATGDNPSSLNWSHEHPAGANSGGLLSSINCHALQSVVGDQPNPKEPGSPMPMLFIGRAGATGDNISCLRRSVRQRVILR